ncbi:MAG: hypothetical protein PHT54_03045 [Candidatus Nanoarchaeia archaeon]|nr:hypothetical protein [Candidatus Nanoarchaeia archaeon]
MGKKICKISKKIMDYVIKNSAEKPEKNKIYFSDIPFRYHIDLVDGETRVGLSVYDHQNRHGISDGKEVVPSSRIYITLTEKCDFSLGYLGRLNGRLEEMYLISESEGLDLKKSINRIERLLHPDRTQRFQKGYEEVLSRIEGII